MTVLERQRITVKSDPPRDFRSILFSRTHSLAFEAGHGRLCTEQIRLGNSGFRTSRVISTGHQIALGEDDAVTLLFPRSGRLALQVAGNETRLGPGDAVLLMPCERQTKAISGRGTRFQGLVLMFPVADLREIAELASASRTLSRDIIPARGNAAQSILGFVDYLMAEANRWTLQSVSERSAASMSALLRNMLADWLIETQQITQPGFDRQFGVDYRRVRQAEEIFREHLDLPLSIAEVAKRLGISLRSLQVAFHKVLNEGPKERLTRLRLERARERLLEGGPGAQVTTVAFDSGFFHLSRFAEAYQRAFGEKPSQTLARGGGTPLQP